MLALINELTDMPDWHRIIFEPETVFEWKSAKLLSGRDITRSMVDWVSFQNHICQVLRFLKPVQCAEEVKYYVSDFAASRIIRAIDGGITKSDDCVDPLLQKELRKAASALRGKKAGAESPTSQVKDVVDPSLFPFAFEKTKVLRYGPTALSDCILRCGEGEAVKMPPEGDGRQSDPIKYPNDMAWSRRFQWLPFDVQFKDGGQGASRYILPLTKLGNIQPG